jgi:hypothetical protein
MPRVARRAIRVDREARRIAAVEPVVAFRAQAAQFAQAEQLVVATVRHDVISDARRHDATGLQAKPAQRLDVQLMPPAALPAGGGVPSVDVRTVRHLLNLSECTANGSALLYNLAMLGIRRLPPPAITFAAVF